MKLVRLADQIPTVEDKRIRCRVTFDVFELQYMGALLRGYLLTERIPGPVVMSLSFKNEVDEREGPRGGSQK